MLRWSIRPGVALAAVLTVSLAPPALAGAPTDQLKDSIDQVIRVLQDPALKPEAKAKERRAAIRQVASATFDFHETARRGLGRHWQSLSEREREEFATLFTDLLEGAYVSRIEQYSGEEVVYGGERVDPGGELATVRTKFVTKKKTDVPIDYRMLRRGERWMVYDVTVEGVSLVSNYRTQFNKVIETASYQELLKRLKTRSQEFKAPGAAQPAKS